MTLENTEAIEAHPASTLHLIRVRDRRADNEHFYGIVSVLDTSSA